MLAARPHDGIAQTTGGLAGALSALDRDVVSTMERTRVPGVAVAVVYRDQVVFLKGYGVKRLGDPGKVDPDTVFELASFSKPIASTIVAEVVGRGDVTWDSRIAKLDPEFKLSDPAITAEVTVRDFFAHRSTLPEGSGDTLEALGYTRPEILSRLSLVKLQGTFRKTYQYSNFGISEGALAATRHLGIPWEQVADDLLYAKLGMHSTSSRFTDYFNRANRASLHYLDESGVFHSRYLREADAESPAGGVSSSARDLAQWMRLQLAGGAYNGKQIVDRQALLETHKPQVCRNPEAADGSCPNNSFYGLGWDVDSRANGEKQLSHSGAFMLGAATTVYMIPDKQIGILVLSNGAPLGLPEAIALNFLDTFEYGAPKREYLGLLEGLFAKMRQGVMGVSTNYSTENPPASPTPGEAPAHFSGTYTNPYFGELTVEEQRGRLILRLPPRGTYYELSHWDGNRYTYYIENEVNGAARRGVEFSADGSQITVENLKLEYSNVFQRAH
jgi:CubicO group peptidase (beta-lactamase class C family)